MSGRLGTCFICKATKEGIYDLTIHRGWIGDKYDVFEEICEDCVPNVVELIKSSTVDVKGKDVFRGETQLTIYKQEVKP